MKSPAASRRFKKLALAAGLAGTALLTAIAPASADTVKIGSALQHPNTP